MIFYWTCPEPYDQCFYLVMPEKEGDAGAAFSDYTDARDYWMRKHGRGLSSIIVMTRDEVKARANED